MIKSLIILILIFPSVVFANGSPINVSEVYSTGNIEMTLKKDITLEKEILDVEIDGDYANVTVEYLFKNHGPSDTVKYGFPFDLLSGPESEMELPKNAITDFKIKDNNGFLKVSKHSEDKNEVQENVYEVKKREWFVSDIVFKEGETKTVTIQYRVKNRLDDWVYTKSFRPRFSDRTFRYVMSPSRNWGKGIVKECLIKIDINKTLKKSGVIKSVSPEGYKNENGVLTWKFSNLDLNKADDIQIVYDNSAHALTEYVKEERIPNKYIVSHKASSVLKTDKINKFNYETKNLFDGDLSTAWVEGVEGNGEGEWIEIEIDNNNFELEAIGIVNGYTKRESLYYANNRIKKIELEINYRQGWGEPEDKTDTTTIILNQKEFNELNKNSNAPFISWLADYGSGRAIKKIRIKILEVYPGTKYKDTPVSELYLLGWAQN